MLERHVGGPRAPVGHCQPHPRGRGVLRDALGHRRAAEAAGPPSTHAFSSGPAVADVTLSEARRVEKVFENNVDSCAVVARIQPKGAPDGLGALVRPAYDADCPG